MPLNTPIANWTDQRVWVIGASTGIGRETARLLSRKGARVAFSARSADKLADAAGGCVRARVLPLDITDAAALVTAAGTLQQEWGGLDLVLIVAGTHDEMRAQDFDLERANALLAINLHGVLNCVAATLPGLLAQGSGHIAIVASIAGLRGLPKALIYGASKAALINFCEALYLDCKPANVNVHLINPGFVATPLTASNDFKMPVLISAEEAAEELVRGLERGDFDIHFPKRFTRWVKLMRLLPYRLYFAAVHRITGL